MEKSNLIDRIKSFNRTSLLLIALVFAVFIFTAFAVIFTLTGNTTRGIFTKPGELEALAPGKATMEDVKKIKGRPLSTEKKGDDTYLYYPTQSEDFKNTITLEQNRVKFSVENVFDSSRGFLNDYKKQYGEPGLIMYDPFDDVIVWNIYLKGGVGIAYFNKNEIAKILYFQPQNKESFIRNIAPALDLRLKRPTYGPDEK